MLERGPLDRTIDNFRKLAENQGISAQLSNAVINMFAVESRGLVLLQPTQIAGAPGIYGLQAVAIPCSADQVANSDVRLVLGLPCDFDPSEDKMNFEFGRLILSAREGAYSLGFHTNGQITYEFLHNSGRLESARQWPLINGTGPINLPSDRFRKIEKAFLDAVYPA